MMRGMDGVRFSMNDVLRERYYENVYVLTEIIESNLNTLETVLLNMRRQTDYIDKEWNIRNTIKIVESAQKEMKDVNSIVVNHYAKEFDLIRPTKYTNSRGE